jgi:organic radical activating enzyme
MFGNNKILAPEIHDGDYLHIQEIFPTIQGEGSFVGHPAVFVRLNGCNLQCDFCDTEFEDFKKISLENILSEIKKFSQNSKNNRVINMVVITGGEPFRQPIEKLCQKLIAENFLVQIETNGTIFRNISKEVKIICSPKVSNGKYYPIRDDLLQRIMSFKFLISAQNPDYSRVQEVGQSQYNIPVYVQPIDEYNEQKNQKNIELAIKICQENGYILSYQLHKILKIK